MIKTSPLFHSYGRDAKEFCVHYTPSELNPSQPSGTAPLEASPGHQLRVKLTPVSWDDAIPVSSVLEAEKLFLDRFEAYEKEVNEPPESRGRYPLTIVINQCANYIAGRTRAGAGNVVIAGKTALSYITSKEWEHSFTFSTDSAVGGCWEEVGKINSGIMVYTSDLVADNEVIVIRIGKNEEVIDAPADLLIDGDELRLHFKQERPDALGMASDYVDRFRMIIT